MKQNENKQMNYILIHLEVTKKLIKDANRFKAVSLPVHTG